MTLRFMFLITVSILYYGGYITLMPIPKHFGLAWKVDVYKDANTYFMRYRETVFSQGVVVSYAYKQVKQVVVPKQSRRVTKGERGINRLERCRNIGAVRKLWRGKKKKRGKKDLQKIKAV